MHVLWWFDIQLSLQAVVGLVVFRYSTECSGCCNHWQWYTTMCCMVDAYWSGSCMSSYRRYHYLVPTSYSCHTVCILFWYLSICDLLQRVVCHFRHCDRLVFSVYGGDANIWKFHESPDASYCLSWFVQKVILHLRNRLGGKLQCWVFCMASCIVSFNA